MNKQVHSGLHGTKTGDNLVNALSGEARSHMRYMLYADAARRNGDETLAEMLEDFADNEKEHAELWAEYLGEMGDNAKNIDTILAGEEYESTVLYPEYSKMAREEGFSEIADKMEMAGNAEANHAKKLADYLEAMTDGSRFEGDENAEWRCTKCGYVHTGKNPPERCPLCSHGKSNYVRDN